MRWNSLLEFAIVGVTERWVVTGLHPRVDTINADESLELVRVVALVEELSEGISGHLFIVCPHLGNLDEFLGVSKLVAKSVPH